GPPAGRREQACPPCQRCAAVLGGPGTRRTGARGLPRGGPPETRTSVTAGISVGAYQRPCTATPPPCGSTDALTWRSTPALAGASELPEATIHSAAAAASPTPPTAKPTVEIAAASNASSRSSTPRREHTLFGRHSSWDASSLLIALKPKNE